MACATHAGAGYAILFVGKRLIPRAACCTLLMCDGFHNLTLGFGPLHNPGGRPPRIPDGLVIAAAILVLANHHALIMGETTIKHPLCSENERLGMVSSRGRARH